LASEANAVFDASHDGRHGVLRVLLRQLDFGLIAAAVIGTSTMPRASAALAHCAMRSIEAGSAEAMPTALPRSRASASSLPSARSI